VEVREIGEFGLIERLRRALTGGHPRLLVGVGDDAAVWRAEGRFLLFTIDSLVSGVHFLPGRHPWEDVGWKALAVNISDIMAMGGVPEVAVVALALPPDMPLDHVDSLYQGLEECARTYDVALAGGDIVQAPQVSIGVALVGRALEGPEGPLLLRRDGARPGHVVAVSGPLGESAAGLRRLLAGAPADDPLVRVHLRPHPPLALGQEAARKGIPCAIDISDGLLQDLGHVARMSGVGIELWAHRIPIPQEVWSAFPREALTLACAGGEDYQLALVGREDIVLSLTPPPTVIGRVIEGEGVRVLDERGHDVTPQERGWNHLRQR